MPVAYFQSPSILRSIHRLCQPTSTRSPRTVSFQAPENVAIATASAVPGTLVNLAAGGGDRTHVTFGHPSGTLRVGAEAKQVSGQWTATKAIMSRSARVLMEGWVRVPGDSL